jgi:heme exporter protein CcmD
MEWWKFNGYGFYVWGSYLTALAVVVIEMTLLRARRTRTLRHINELGESS